MASLRSEIGPLTQLFAFEAAGRLGSFTRAAAELGVTQAAVSKQIVALEDWTGRRLFRRKGRGVALTEPGQDLFEATTLALSAIARSMREIRMTPRPLTLALSIPMSRFWLMPHLQAFTASHPGIPIRIDAREDPASATGADIVIAFHRTGEAPADARRLFGAEVMAMAAPGFVARHPLATAAEVIRAPLIHYDAPDRNWLTWRDWAHHAGLAATSLRAALSVSRYEDALVAAEQGQGAVLVWCIGGRPLVPDGGLVPLPGPRLAAPGAFSLRLGPPQPGTAAVLDWLTGLSDAG